MKKVDKSKNNGSRKSRPQHHRAKTFCEQKNAAQKMWMAEVQCSKIYKATLVAELKEILYRNLGSVNKELNEAIRKQNIYVCAVLAEERKLYREYLNCI